MAHIIPLYLDTKYMTRINPLSFGTRYIASCITPVIHMWYFKVYYMCKRVHITHVLMAHVVQHISIHTLHVQDIYYVLYYMYSSTYFEYVQGIYLYYICETCVSQLFQMSIKGELITYIIHKNTTDVQYMYHTSNICMSHLLVCITHNN